MLEAESRVGEEVERVMPTVTVGVLDLWSG